MKNNVYLSVIIPAYNEETNIAGTLVDIAEYLGKKDFTYDITVIDDGSSDNTIKKAWEVAAKLPGLRVIKSSPNRGKGYVVKKGVLGADGDYVMFMDADNSTSIRELDSFLPQLKEGFDVYIASRRVPGSDVKSSLERRLMGAVYIIFARLILGIKVNDINCGFKLFKKSAAKNTFSRQIMDDWSFDAEVLYLCGKNGYRVKEIPVKWVHKDTSKVRPLRDGINSFISLMRIRMNDIKGKYKG